jgi:hypothetical protein
MYTIFWTNGFVSRGDDLSKVLTDLGEFKGNLTYGGYIVRQYINGDVHLTKDLPTTSKCRINKF